MRGASRRLAALPLAGALACGRAPAGAAPQASAAAPPAAAPTYLKGQLHLHSDASGDSDTPAAEVVRWYAGAGFDFIVFTDHNRITAAAGAPGLLVLPGVELTQNLEACEPPPEPGLGCPLHVNALFVDPGRARLLRDRPLPASVRRLDRYDFAVDLGDALGGLPLVNHPNFHYAADAALLGELAARRRARGRGPLLLEVANEAIDSNNEGDADHPSTEALWDALLTAGHRVYGVATDDAHHYGDAAATRARGEVAHVGDRGFVMVRAPREAAAIRAALARGDFYASDGLLLARVDVDGDALTIEVGDDAAPPVRTTFIGAGGRALAEVEGRRARFDLRALGGGHVRAKVVDGRGRRAWVQPVWPGG